MIYQTTNEKLKNLWRKKRGIRKTRCILCNIKCKCKDFIDRSLPETSYIVVKYV